MHYQPFTTPGSANFALPTLTPAASFVDTGSQYELLVEMPGVRPEKLDVIIEGPYIVIRGEREVPECLHRSTSTLMQNECAFGRIERVVQLPMIVETSKIEAQLSHGILNIRLPKKGTEDYPYKEVSVTNGSTKSTKVNVKQ